MSLNEFKITLFEVRELEHVGKPGEANFEDGTIPFLSIASLRFGFEAVNRIGMRRIAEHTFRLAKYFYVRLENLKYPAGNGNPVARIYSSGSFGDVATQGGIVNFNLVSMLQSFFFICH
jgi:molybdenum cofactor sulfurtransferase